MASHPSLEAVLLRLGSPRLSLSGQLPDLPDVPGLYAIYGDERAWVELGLGAPAPDLPLYVGKAEDSLAARDIRTHFSNARTGSSTLRRSTAALLRFRLELTGMPRNPARPGHFSNYGLSPGDDAKLTEWLRARLTISVCPLVGLGSLAAIEADVLRFWNPPLNISGVQHRWKADLQRRRKYLADQARAWRPVS